MRPRVHQGRRPRLAAEGHARVTAVAGTFYLTTPIYYVNALPHLGHAYTTIAADAMARYHRLAGEDVWFLTGTDEHGERIAQIAAAANVPPLEYADKISAQFRQTWDRLGLRYDDYIRTTEARHQKVVQAILQQLWDAGEIYLGKYGGYYCYGCERFYTEKEIVDGKCPDHLTPLTWIEEENYFFKMSKYQGWLIDYVNQHPDLIRPGAVSQRDPRLPARSAPGPLHQPAADAPHVGHPAAVRRQVRHLRLVRRPHQLRLRARRPRRSALREVLAGRPAPDRQGHPQAARGVLALHAEGGRPPALPAPQRPRLLDGRAATRCPSRSATSSSRWRFAAEYGAVGHDAFRYFVLREMTFGLDADFARGRVRHPAQRRSRQRPRQPGLAGDDADRQLSRRRPARPAPATAEEETVHRAAAEAAAAARRGDGGVRLPAGAGRASGSSSAPSTGTSTRPSPGRWPRSRPSARASTVCWSRWPTRCATSASSLDPFVPDAAAKIRAAVGQTSPPRLADARARAPGPAAAGAEALRPLPAPRRQEGPTPAAATGRKRRPTPAISPARRDRRLRQGRAARGRGPRRRGGAEVQEAAQAHGLAGQRAAHRRWPASPSTTRRPTSSARRWSSWPTWSRPSSWACESQGMVLAGSTDGDGALAVLTLDRDLPPGAKVR